MELPRLEEKMELLKNHLEMLITYPSQKRWREIEESVKETKGEIKELAKKIKLLRESRNEKLLVATPLKTVHKVPNYELKCREIKKEKIKLAKFEEKIELLGRYLEILECCPGKEDWKEVEESIKITEIETKELSEKIRVSRRIISGEILVKVEPNRLHKPPGRKVKCKIVKELSVRRKLFK